MKMKSILIGTCIALLSAVSVCGAASTFEGEIGVTGVIKDIKGDHAKANEYSDINSGVFGDLRLRYDSDQWFLRFKGSDFGYDTQNYKLEGGSYGIFKAYILYNELPHNYTENARSFYSGVGTNNLTYITAPPVPPGIVNPNTWPSTFDYEVKRKTFETGLKLDVIKPFYLTTSFSQEKRDGLKPNWIGISPSNTVIELPEPVDYTTNTFNIEAGYASRPLFAALYYTYVNFENDNDLLNFRNPLSAGTVERYTLPPDNTYYKFGFKGSLMLPLNSKFSVNLSNARAKSETNLVDTLTAGTLPPAGLTSSTYHGRVDTENYSFALTSNPLSFLTGKIFYTYHARKDKSDIISYPTATGTATNDLFSYRKNTYGVDMQFALPAHFTLGTAYTHVDLNRQRLDIPETHDNIYAAKLKWAALDFFVPKIGYEFMNRSASRPSVAGLEVIGYAFDAAAKDQHTFKAGFELYPLANLSFDFDYKYKKEKYTDSPEGLQSVKSDGIEFSAAYTIGTFAQLNGYLSYEHMRSFQFQKATAADNWSARMEDDSFGYGIGAEVFLVPKKLTLVLQHDYVKSNGFADFTYYQAPALTGGRTNDNIDIPNYDDYRKSSYMAKLKYSPIAKMTLSAGYAYERYRYDDAQYQGYDIASLANATAASNRFYLTGAFANPNYQSHVFFLGVSTQF